MPMMIAMRVIISEHTAIIPLIEAEVYISEIVARNPAPIIHPHLAPQFAVALATCDYKTIIVDFFIRHDKEYHGWGGWQESAEVKAEGLINVGSTETSPPQAGSVGIRAPYFIICASAIL